MDNDFQGLILIGRHYLLIDTAYFLYFILNPWLNIRASVITLIFEIRFTQFQTVKPHVYRIRWYLIYTSKQIFVAFLLKQWKEKKLKIIEMTNFLKRKKKLIK